MYFTEFSEYLLPLTTLKRDQTRDSNGNFFTSAGGNVSSTRWMKSMQFYSFRGD